MTLHQESFDTSESAVNGLKGGLILSGDDRRVSGEDSRRDSGPDRAVHPPSLAETKPP